MCVYHALMITGVQFFQTELKTVRKVSADANLKRFQHKILWARRKTTIYIGEYRVAQPIARNYLLRFFKNIETSPCLDV